MSLSNQLPTNTAIALVFELSWVWSFVVGAQIATVAMAQDNGKIQYDMIL